MRPWDFLIGLVSGAGGLSVLAFLSREWLNHRLDISRERVKWSLALQNEICKFRSQKLADFWSAYSAVDTELTAILLARGRIVDDELRAMGKDAKGAVAAAKKLPPGCVSRITTE